MYCVYERDAETMEMTGGNFTAVHFPRPMNSLTLFLPAGQSLGFVKYIAPQLCGINICHLSIQYLTEIFTSSLR
jgi:hypothetical protein